MYFIEIFQAFTGRLPEIDDLIANTAGFLIGYLTAQGFLELFDDDRTIWYGTQAGKVENCTKKCDKRKEEKTKSRNFRQTRM